MASVASVTLLASAVIGVSTAHAVDSINCASFTSDVRQLVKPTTGANLLTPWPAEIASAKDLYGFTDDRGVIAQAASLPGPGLTPVWRLYRAGDFVWATDGADADGFVAAGYLRQFVDFHASTSPASCLAPLNRLKRAGVHRVATASQTPSLLAAGWVSAGTSFYAAAADPAPATDTKFSIAVIPDTQNEISSLSGTRFSNRVSWLVNNKANLDLRYAMQIGDLTSWGHVEPAQFEKASNEIKPLEAAFPWAVAAGNHDVAAVCVGGSACPGADASVTVRDASVFNRYFPPSRFDNLRGTYEPGKSENSYATFSSGGREWMVLTLELWARPGVVTWANNVVRANPDHNVIVVTHAYLNSDGSIGTTNGGYGSTSPRYVFDNLIKVHPNIKMVVSGHVGQATARTDTGNAGNKILSFLQAFHNTTNPVRLVEIDTAADTVTSRIYAPYTNTSYPEYSTSTTGMDFR